MTEFDWFYLKGSLLWMTSWLGHQRNVSLARVETLQSPHQNFSKQTRNGIRGQGATYLFSASWNRGFLRRYAFDRHPDFQTYTSHGIEIPKYTLDVYLDNKCLLARIDRWNHQGPKGGKFGIGVWFFTGGDVLKNHRTMLPLNFWSWMQSCSQSLHDFFLYLMS